MPQYTFTIILDTKVSQRLYNHMIVIPDSKVHGAYMGSTWGRLDPGGPMLAPWTLLSGIVDSESDISSQQDRLRAA